MTAIDDLGSWWPRLLTSGGGGVNSRQSQLSEGRA